MTILQVALPKIPGRVFDYLPPLGVDKCQLLIASRVQVPFRRSQQVGFIVAMVEQSAVPLNKLKPINKLLDDEPLVTTDVLQLCQWASHYFHYPLGDILSVALPKQLRQGQAAQLPQQTIWQLTAGGMAVPSETLSRAKKQQLAINQLQQHPLGLTSSQLKALGITQATLKALQEKEWVKTSYKTCLLAGSHSVDNITLTLNTEQQHVIDTISQRLQEYQCYLLHGVTGSGKTEVYIRIMQQVLDAGRQCLVLVPEIGLTPQTLERFQRRFHVPVTMLHSGLNDSERCTAWLYAKQGMAKIIIGTRSAVFTPMAQLGLVIVDEEHDPSFKQQDGVRYSARDLAVVRAHLLSIPIILGSATPSLESLYNAVYANRYQLMTLNTRAGKAHYPDIRLIDLRAKRLQQGMSDELLTSTRQHLDAGNQVLLFINRRGYAPVMMCHQCGWIADCQHCDAHLTLHQQPRYLQCHHCGQTQAVVATCPQCNHTELHTVGVGTEQLEEQLASLFPDTALLRIDRDSTRRKGSLQLMLEKIHQGGPMILIGTQMLAKGHHFPNVTMVAVLNADSGFFSSEFRASERLGQLLIQVAGRAGRADKPGEVFIQTHHPDHPLLQCLLSQGYRAFTDLLFAERQRAGFPPYGHLALFRSQANIAQDAMTVLDEIKNLCQPHITPRLQMLGPISAPMEKRAGQYRAQLLLHGHERRQLQELLKQVLPLVRQTLSQPKARWSVDIDPIELF